MDMQERTDIEIQKYCDIIRKLLLQRAYDECERRTIRMMERFPHLPDPHNLYGVLLEKRGEHLLALKHFRAALSLDPSHAPAIHNLETYATLFSHGAYAIDESDCKSHEIRKECSGLKPDEKGYAEEESEYPCN